MLFFIVIVVVDSAGYFLFILLLSIFKSSTKWSSKQTDNQIFYYRRIYNIELNWKISHANTGVATATFVPNTCLLKFNYHNDSILTTSKDSEVQLLRTTKLLQSFASKWLHDFMC